MFNKLLLTYFLLFASIILHSQTNPTIVRGCHKTFANQKITITAEDDFITGTPKVLYSTVADKNGCFSAKLNLTEIAELKIIFGKFIGLLYAEPERDYDLLLPEFENKTIVDSLNPYFEPVGFYFKIKNPVLPELTDVIANFDNIFNQFLNQYFLHISLSRYYDTQIDTLPAFIDSLFSDVTHQYFIDYKNYSIASLYALTLVKNHQTTIKDYFSHKQILYNNPAYADLFNELFKDYLPYYADTRQGKRLVADIAKAKSYSFAMETLGNNPLLTDSTFRELVLIKSIHDALSMEQLPISSCFQTLDSIKIYTKSDIHKDIIDNIKQKTMNLAIGTKIPPFELVDVDGNTVKTRDLQGKYVYLNFINIKSFTADEELKALKFLYKKYQDKLRIVTVATGAGNMPLISKVFRDNNYEWLLLDGTNDDEILDKYKVVASPTCYLISSELRFILSPSPAPNNHFEFYFIKELREERIRKLRHEGSQPSSTIEYDLK
ncbi:MAG TPA: TlpA disulfide reductase family protein [Salinivirgaceae bacterium]|nr:TlpA disulfide reductase family protein [Salinivirgaceae bacterium]